MAGLFDIAVVGGGIAGLTAAHHAALAGASVVHVLGEEAIGGLVLNVGRLEGYPAGPGELSGLDLAMGLKEVAGSHGVEHRNEAVTGIERAGAEFRLATADGQIRARRLIAALGARLRPLDVPGAMQLYNRGISQCAWCDASLYKGRDVAVVGGGDAALESAMHLARFASRVTIVTRGDSFRARRSYVERIAESENVEFRWLSDVLEVVGRDRVEALRIKDNEEGAEAAIACDGVFVFIGVDPASELIGHLSQLDASGAVVTDAHLRTATSGLYAVGALRSGFGGRLVHAVSDGAIAAIHAAADLEE